MWLLNRGSKRPAVPFSTLLEGFLLGLQAEGRRPRTVEFYSARLRTFLRDLGDRPVEAYFTEDLRRWLVALQQRTTRSGRTISARYVDHHRKAAQRFFRWCIEEGYIERTPFERVRSVRVREHELAILTLDQIAALLGTQPRTTFEGVRNRTMMCLLYDTGVRVGELVHIELPDIDFREGDIRVDGKTGEGTVPISRRMRGMLWDFVHRWRPISLTTRLFTDRQGLPLLETSLNQWMKRAARVAGITDVRVSPHTWRHTFGTHYIRNGGDEMSLMRILRHTTTAMTRRYVHLGRGDVKARHDLWSPLERMG